MTQISVAEITQSISAAPLPIFTQEAIVLAIATFAIGILLYRSITKRKIW
jgi:hypothetical protein